MNKRSFLKVCSALISSQYLAPFLRWAGTEKLKNWAGNFEYGTGNLYAAKSSAQIREFIKGQPSVKVFGTRHCFNKIADSTRQFISLREMDQVVDLDTEARTVTVEGGLTYGRLCPHLHSKGWALHNLASLPHISIAGACSTATHGSGERLGNLATAVSAIEIVNAAGEVVQLSRQRDTSEFRGAVVGLGALGAITKITLDIQPSFQMQQYVYENLPLSELKKHFDAIESDAYSVSLFTDWQNQRINEVWLKCRMDQAPAFAVPPEFFGAKRATRKLHPIAELSSENCTEQMGVPGPWYDRLPHFKMGFTPSAGKELQAEYFVPRHNAVDAILAVERLHEQIGPHLLITEIRAIAADDLWMSPCYKQPCVTIHFTWKQDWPAVSKLLPVIEKELAPFRPRPHWGKLFSISPAQLHSVYEKLPDFVALATKFDPQGKFRNDFLNTNVFGVSS
jgi:xylitol oxidase